MLLLRAKSRTVISLPLGSIVMFAFVGLLLAVQVPAGRLSLGMIVALGVFGLFVLTMIVSELRVTGRRADELRFRWTFGAKRWSAEDHVLRASMAGMTSPILDIVLVRRGASRHEEGTTVAVLGASAKGRGQAEAIAKLLDIPLTGDLPEPGSK